MGIIAVLLAAGLAALPSEPGALQKVAVLDVQAPEADADLVPVMTEVLSAELARTGRFTSVIAGRDIKAMLSFEERKQILGCTDDSCLAEIGGALGADRIVVSSLTQVGSSRVLTLKLIDITRASTDARVYRTIEGDAGAVLQALSAAVDELLGAPAQPSAPAVALQAPAPAGPGLRAGPIVLLAVGASSLGAGLGFGLSAKSHYDAAVQGTQVGSQRSIQTGQTHQTIANLAFGLGAAAVLAGGLWWWLGSEPSTPTVAPGLGPDGASLVMAGRF